MKFNFKEYKLKLIACWAIRSIQAARSFGAASIDRFSHLPKLNASNLHIENVKMSNNSKIRCVPTPQELIGKWGAVFTDHMLEIHWDDQNGFSDPKIVKYGDIVLSPAAKCLHYGLQLFEGLKAYLDNENRICLFRPDMNIKRLNSGLERLHLPMVDPVEMLKLIKRLVIHEKRWIIPKPGCSLYLRPVALGTEPCVSARESREMRIYCICCPVGPYFPIGLKPAKLMADTDNVRAWPGGIGAIKAGGNYAPTMLPLVSAKKEHGCDQVLWLFGSNHAIQEAGAMNFFCAFQLPNGDIELVTPSLETNTILPGITRSSIIELVSEWGKPYRVTEREVTMGEIEVASKKGTLLEIFICGTGAIVIPVKMIMYKGRDIVVPTGEDAGPITGRILQELTDIQRGITTHGDWSIIIDENLTENNTP